MDQNNNQYSPNEAGAPENNFAQTNTAWTRPQVADEVNKSMSELASSVRILEDRYLNLRKKSQLTDQNFMELQKEYFKEKKHLNQDLIETKIKLQELMDELKIMRGELKDTVKQKDIKILNTYLDLWEPMQFITRKQVDELLKQDY